MEVVPYFSAREKTGCQEILELLQRDDLFSLKDTVTNRLVTVEGKQEAIQAILAYSQSAKELLKRKKVHRDVIFIYLAKHGVVMPPSSEKPQLIERALEYWKEPAAESDLEPKTAFKKKSEAETQANENKSSCPYQAMGEQFCQWFFQLLNSQNPVLAQKQGDWGPQHFWEDVTLKLNYSTSEEQSEEFHGAELVSLRLLALVKDELLLLNPNLDASGVKCAISAHGLVVVAVAGTIHRDTLCLGIFEQIFGLIRCPLGDNNWKIKNVTLRIKGRNTLQYATSVPPPTIEYQSKELEVFYG
ncbi:uncharacterized protein C3orf38 homolog [Latimeria chalumnae]|uniref:NTF2 domain-containing protein n=1 Tax=Latimeria chalumnae TaxID=7897 RepID=H3AND4_LATCH|nr:PREDICTED: uncharacterized protein C3orf38 homolog [Latimeria chalumnae]|eukprot:XP_006008793.1 PREDICTED: uncharacterized protein C3orf38 homolog [Latimeria chalumnae]